MYAGLNDFAENFVTYGCRDTRNQSFECPFRCLDFVIHDHVAQSQFSFMLKLAKLEINLVLSQIFFSELYLSSPQSLGLDCEGKTLLG